MRHGGGKEKRNKREGEKKVFHEFFSLTSVLCFTLYFSMMYPGTEFMSYFDPSSPITEQQRAKKRIEHNDIIALLWHI